MSTYGRLAYTGPTALAVGGTALDWNTALAVAVSLVVAGAFAIRVGFRRSREIGQR